MLDDFEFSLDDFDLGEFPFHNLSHTNDTNSDPSSPTTSAGASPTSTAVSSAVSSSASSVTTVASTTSKSGVKRQVKAGKPAKSNTTAVVAKHNMSRSTRCNVLYAFPSFDKCDSLLFFPNTMTKQLNSGDLEGLTKLLSTHLHRDCDIGMQHAPMRFDAKLFVSFFEALGDMQPDRIMCIHSTKVVENEIFATLYMKFTDSPELSRGVLRTITHEGIKDVLGGERKESLREKLCFETRGTDEQSALLPLIDSQQDLTIYVRGAIRITFDDFTKKITKMHMTGELTSVQPVD